MRILVVYAHPLETSFVSALHARVVETLRAGGHIVDDLDLHAERFDPVMSREQMLAYVDTKANTREVERTSRACAPPRRSSWCFRCGSTACRRSCRAISSGCFCPASRCASTKPGSSTPIYGTSSGWPRSSAYGESRRDVAAKRDPPRRFVRDNIGALIDPNGRFEYIALYDMNFTTAPRRAAFMKRVTRVFQAWRESTRWPLIAEASIEVSAISTALERAHTSLKSVDASCERVMCSSVS